MKQKGIAMGKVNSNDRYGKARPITMRCQSCKQPYDLVAITEDKRGERVFCPSCGGLLGKVS